MNIMNAIRQYEYEKHMCKYKLRTLTFVYTKFFTCRVTCKM